MRRSTLQLVLGISSLCAAWIVPQDLADGVWHITLPHGEDNTTEPSILKRGDILGHINPSDVINETATPTWHPDPVLPINPFPPTRHGRLEIPVTAFDCIYREPRLDEAAYETARENLFAYCKHWRLPPKTVHIAAAKSGDVIVYSCSWSRKPRSCSELEFTFLEHHWMDKYCGKLTSAWTASRTMRRSYGRTWMGSDICKTDIYGRFIPKLYKHYWIGRPEEVDIETEMKED